MEASGWISLLISAALAAAVAGTCTDRIKSSQPGEAMDKRDIPEQVLDVDLQPTRVRGKVKSTQKLLREPNLNKRPASCPLALGSMKTSLKKHLIFGFLEELGA